MASAALQRAKYVLREIAKGLDDRAVTHAGTDAGMAAAAFAAAYVHAITVIEDSEKMEEENDG